MRPGDAVLIVLPFQTQGGTADEAVIAQGLLEDITGELGRFSTLQVLAWSAGIGLADLPDAEIRARLGVSHVLRGSLRSAGERFRIAAGLVECEGGTHVWSERFDIPKPDLFEVQDDVVARIAAALNARIEQGALARARARPGDMAAYALTLEGYASLREGSVTADDAARALFERALARDPHYARAHAGIALSWFNEWSCQFWDRFEECGQRAYASAHAALALDDRDAWPHQILGKLHLFRRDWERASWYFDRALALAPNDPELLISQAMYDAYLGRPEIGIRNAARAMRLNPSHPPWYPALAALAHLTAGEMETALDLAARFDGAGAVDMPAFWAVACAHLGRFDEAKRHFARYEQDFQLKILFGRTPEPGEAVRWFVQNNPFRDPAHLDLMLEGFRRIDAPTPAPVPPHPDGAPCFARSGEGWVIAYDGRQILLPHLKGFSDIRLLLERPGQEIHCLDLAGQVPSDHPGDDVLDDTARAAIKARIRDLQEDIAEAEDRNDIGRTELLRDELDRLIDTLSSALGLGGRSRRLGSIAERARTTVTWRIRNATRRIETAHPALGRHFSHSLRTGTFCSYNPEQKVAWQVS